MKTKNKFRIGILILVTVLCVSLYKPALNYFIGQAANPSGPIGYVMTKIWNNTFDKMTNWGLEVIEIKEDDYILDVGSGGGETINKLAKQTPQGKVFGIDISEDAVKSSLQRNQEWVEVDRVEIEQADVASLPYEDDTFHKVTAIQTHIYWEELEKGFSEIYRVLIAEGTLLIICEKDKIEYHMKEYSENDTFISLLQTIGFKDVEIREYGNWVEFIVKK